MTSTQAAGSRTEDAMLERIADGPFLPDELADEESLVFLDEAQFRELDYVREKKEWTSRPRSKPGRLGPDVILLGYAVLSRDAEASPDSGQYRRRVFFLLPHDRNGREDNGTHHGGSPVEAVDPRTVAPGVPGYKTPRSQAKPPLAATA